MARDLFYRISESIPSLEDICIYPDNEYGTWEEKTNDKPILEDNLYEAWMKFRNNPDIPVTIIEGPGDCCICTPCHSFVPERGICVCPCHLRDRKKDLDTMVALGLNPGDTLSARELYKRIYKKIPHCRLVCGYDKDTNFEWTRCGGSFSGQYERGLKKGILE